MQFALKQPSSLPCLLAPSPRCQHASHAGTSTSINVALLDAALSAWRSPGPVILAPVCMGTHFIYSYFLLALSRFKAGLPNYCLTKMPMLGHRGKKMPNTITFVRLTQKIYTNKSYLKVTHTNTWSSKLPVGNPASQLLFSVLFLGCSNSCLERVTIWGLEVGPICVCNG